MTPNHARRTASRQIASTARLSCKGCTERKKKCDKLIPCTNCRNSGVNCVPIERRRLPRGRTRRVGDLLAGQNNTPDLLADQERFRWTMPSPDLTSPAVVSTTLPAMESSDVFTQQFFPDTRDFNESLRDVGTHQEGTAWDRYEGQTMLRTGHNSDNHWIGEQPTSAFLNQFRLAVCGRSDNFQQRQKLLNTYLTQIDPLVKIVHRPSLLAHILGGTCYLQYDLWHPAPTALASAIYYAASCTLSQETCRSSFGMDKDSLISKYRKDLDCALERADYLVTNDLTVLQAFVISLIALGCHDRSRRFWTMIALALRIAQALAIHDPNPPFPINPFEKEMRRRLWHAIGWLDMQASLSSASEPMVQSSWLIFQPFHTVNDDEFGPNSEIQMFSHTGISDTTFFSLLSHAQETARYLTVSNSDTPYTNDIHRRQQLVRTFKWRVDELITGLQPEHINFHWYLKEVAHSILVFLQLLAFRPLKHDISSEACPAAGVNMLKLAVEVLDSRRRVHTNRKAEPWQWIEPLFFPWQALAVALTEVQACEDLSLIESVWPSIEQSYARFINFDNGSLPPRVRRSINELIEHARKRHEHLLLSAISNEDSNEFARIPLPSMVQHQAPSHLSTAFWNRANVSAPAAGNPLPGTMISHVNNFASWFDEYGEVDLFSVGA